MDNKLIPPAIKGKNTDLETFLELKTVDVARETFKSAKNRMFNPPVWHQLAGTASAEFELTDREGRQVNRPAEKGDFLRIDIPGPGPSAGAGDGYDWVTVTMIEENNDPALDEQYCSLQLKAAHSPEGQKNVTAHFFREDATSTFIISRKQTKITATYHGRNELPNTDTGKPMDNIRNSLVALGAFAFLSELQWKSLIKGFLEGDDEN
ncbi:MAG: hypothetical protein ABIS01_00695 [Ferruginibacter sp.]